MELQNRKNDAAPETAYIYFDMVYVKGGTLTMGCTVEPCYLTDEKAHSVTVGDFSIGRYEVTQGLWKAVMGNNPSYFKGNDNLPVETVSWDDVQEFIWELNEKTKKNYRLPTLDEWEYAARGGTNSKGYKYSGSNDIDDVAWYEKNSSNKTHIVGTKQANELGIYDMSGNVIEWTDNKIWTSYRYLAGCDWEETSARYCRVFRHAVAESSSGTKSFGFRLALSPD
ncbi:MAG: formylglycine-generating enzyme family protein [Candidatus Fibromonas sp.]|nr:formylglycine-generating enzyme family protein [Candidatus Fibromonas sp.]